MGAYATAADYDNEGIAELRESFIGKEDAVARQLLQDQVFVVVAQSCSLRECFAPVVFFLLL